MKKQMKWITLILCLLILALMITPLGLIYYISIMEREAYATPDIPKLQQHALGGIAQAVKADMQESVSVSGTFVSTSYSFMDLEMDHPASVRWIIEPGQQVQEGQTIGFYQGEPVRSTLTGQYLSMDLTCDAPYIKFLSYEPIELSCRVQDRVLSILEMDVELKTMDGEPVEVVYISALKNTDGTTDVRLKIDSDQYYYGQEVTSIHILTGRVFSNVIYVPFDCVYQKAGSSGWFVREVTEKGVFIREIPVELGYVVDGIAYVSGITEGSYYDAGYKAVLGG